MRKQEFLKISCNVLHMRYNKVNRTRHASGFTMRNPAGLSFLWGDLMKSYPLCGRRPQEFFSVQKPVSSHFATK